MHINLTLVEAMLVKINEDVRIYMLTMDEAYFYLNNYVNKQNLLLGLAYPQKLYSI